MGEPSSQTKPEYYLSQVVESMVRGKQVPERALRDTGLDLEHLVGTYEESIRPYLDYLQGYKPLEELDPAYIQRNPEYRPDNTWEKLQARYGLTGKYSQVIPVAYVMLYCFTKDREEGMPEHIRIQVFLSRDGDWILWYAPVGYSGGITWSLGEKFVVQSNLREFWQELRQLVPGYYSLAYHGGYHAPKSLALFIERGLRQRLEATIEAREKRLEPMKAALKDAEKRNGGIIFGGS